MKPEQEIERLQKIIVGLAERVVHQAELLSQRAEKAMVYAVEVWTIPDVGGDDEEFCNHTMVQCEEFGTSVEAMRWAWDRMEEGYYTRMWRR